jgi:hypothetical protein
VFDANRPDTSTQKLILQGRTNSKAAFKVKTTAPRRYCVRPNSGIINGFDEVVVDVILQPGSKSTPEDKKGKADKFLVQCVLIDDADSTGDPGALIVKYKNKVVEHKLRCIFTEERPPRTSEGKRPSPATPVESKPSYSKPSASAASPSAFGEARPSRDLDDQRAEMDRLKAELKAQREQLQTARSELQQARTTQVDQVGLRSRVVTKPSEPLSLKLAGPAKKESKGFSLPVVAIIAVVMFMLGFYLNGVLME